MEHKEVTTAKDIKPVEEVEHKCCGGEASECCDKQCKGTPKPDRSKKSKTREDKRQAELVEALKDELRIYDSWTKVLLKRISESTPKNCTPMDRLLDVIQVNTLNAHAAVMKLRLAYEETRVRTRRGDYLHKCIDDSLKFMYGTRAGLIVDELEKAIKAACAGKCKCDKKCKKNVKTNKAKKSK